MGVSYAMEGTHIVLTKKLTPLFLYNNKQKMLQVQSWM